MQVPNKGQMIMPPLYGQDTLTLHHLAGGASNTRSVRDDVLVSRSLVCQVLCTSFESFPSCIPVLD